MPVAARVRHHRFGRRRAVRRLGAEGLSGARRHRREAAGRRDVRGLHRRRLRPADVGAHHRARADHAGRHRRRAGRRRGRAEHRGAGAARRRRPGHRDRRAGGSARRWRREMGADASIDLDATTPEERLERVLGAHRRAAAPTWWSKPPDRRARSRKACGSRATAARTSLPATTRTSATARSTRTSTSTASISTSAAAGAAKCGTFCARCARSSAMETKCPWRSIGARTFGLARLNDALAAAERLDDSEGARGSVARRCMKRGNLGLGYSRCPALCSAA